MEGSGNGVIWGVWLTGAALSGALNVGLRRAMGSCGMFVSKGGTQVDLWVGKIHQGWSGEHRPSGPYLFTRPCPLASASGPGSFGLQLS